MSFAEFNKLADSSLRDVYARQPFDYAKARKAVIRQIDSIAKSFAEGKGIRKPRNEDAWGDIANGVVAFNPIINGEKLFLEAKTFSDENFPAALAAFKAGVEAGELDPVLSGETQADAPKVKRTRKPKAK